MILFALYKGYLYQFLNFERPRVGLLAPTEKRHWRLWKILIGRKTFWKTCRQMGEWTARCFAGSNEGAPGAG